MLNGTKTPVKTATEPTAPGAVPLPEGIPQLSSADGNVASLASSVSSLNDPNRLSDSLAASSLSGGSGELSSILAALASDGMTAIDISSDEVSKSHLRYLVGGKTSVDNERIFRFEFPERPGALRKFLVGMQSGWNISLFHYRNHGADVGKILLGIQAPKEESGELDEFLKSLGYMYHEETQNPVIRRYLGSHA